MEFLQMIEIGEQAGDFGDLLDVSYSKKTNEIIFSVFEECHYKQEYRMNKDKFLSALEVLINE